MNVSCWWWWLDWEIGWFGDEFWLVLDWFWCSKHRFEWVVIGFGDWRELVWLWFIRNNEFEFLMICWFIDEIDEWFWWIKMIGRWFKWFGTMGVGLDDFVSYFDNFQSKWPKNVILHNSE